MLYPKGKAAHVATYDPKSDKINKLGAVNHKSIDLGPGFKPIRVAGAGGIAADFKGGVHVVYSSGKKLFLTNVRNPSVVVSVDKEQYSPTDVSNMQHKPSHRIDGKSLIHNNQDLHK